MSVPGANNSDQSPSLEPLCLTSPDPRRRGEVHGEHWREAIAQRAALRLELELRSRDLAASDSLLADYERHWPQLEQHVPAMAQELRGIAQGADLSPSRVLMLNTDPQPPSAGTVHGRVAEDGAACVGSTAVYFNGVGGPLLGLTVDRPAYAEAFVRMLRIAPTDTEHETLCLTLVGSLGIAGIASTGVAVTLNGLRSTETSVGVLASARVRAMLAQPDAATAHALLRAMPRCGGHHTMIADGHDYYGVETNAALAVLTQLGPRAAHLHTNHYFDPILRRSETRQPGSTSHHRLNLATTIYAQQRPRDVEGMWSLLHSRDGSAGSLCVEPDAKAGPHAMATCAVMVMGLHDGRVRVVRGAAHRSPPRELSIRRWVGQPPRE